MSERTDQMFVKVGTFKGRIYTTKSDAQYEELFEELMRYSDFESVSNILSKTKKNEDVQINLNRFIDSVVEDARKHNHNFNPSPDFRNKMTQAFLRKLSRRSKK